MKPAETSEAPRGKRIIRTKEVLAKVPWSRTTLWRRVRDGSFPPPIRLGPNLNGWLEQAVDDKIDELVAEAAE
jgi:prophage regulatory protein